ncbi:hypothetical protein CW304_07065 [Bacillus sp. UFRGS-B20]|nr:hypothetical protein CW304_07065 [Bacillus sp. UFRGS-B20]
MSGYSPLILKTNTLIIYGGDMNGMVRTIVFRLVFAIIGREACIGMERHMETPKWLGYGAMLLCITWYRDNRKVS